jgi:hypothetical protein
MKSKTYHGEVRSSEKDFETLQLGVFATPDLLLAQEPVGLTAESGFNDSASPQVLDLKMLRLLYRYERTEKKLAMLFA